MSDEVRREPPEPGTLGFILVALVVVFTVLGYLADRWLHTVPWLMIGGVLVGAVLGFGYLVFILFAGSPKRGRKSEPKGGGKGPDEDSS